LVVVFSFVTIVSSPPVPAFADPPAGAGDPARCPVVAADLAPGEVRAAPVNGGVPGDRVVHTLIRAGDVDVRRLTCGIDVRLFLPGDAIRVRGVLVRPWASNAGPGGYQEEGMRPHAVGSVVLKFRDELAEWYVSKGATLGKALVAALARFALATQHPELAWTPFLLVGQSRGGVWSRDIAYAFPDRTIAYASTSGWIANPEDDRGGRVPALFILGSETTPAEPWRMLTSIATQYLPGAALGRPWALAVQWGKNEHSSDNEAALIVPFFEAMVRARVPARPPEQGSVRLRPIDGRTGWRGDRATWRLAVGEMGGASRAAGVTRITSVAATSLPRILPPGTRADRRTTWLPDRRTAHVWRAFVGADAAPSVSLRDGGRTLLGGTPRRAVIEAGREVELALEGVATREVLGLRFWDGDRPIGAAGPSLLFRWRGASAGAHVVIARWRDGRGRPRASRPVLLVVSKRGAGVLARR
jgi:hypothetical protein